MKKYLKITLFAASLIVVFPQVSYAIFGSSDTKKVENKADDLKWALKNAIEKPEFRKSAEEKYNEFNRFVRSLKENSNAYKTAQRLLRDTLDPLLDQLQSGGSQTYQQKSYQQNYEVEDRARYYGRSQQTESERGRTWEPATGKRSYVRKY